jgi:sialate O-acetylesterase
MRLLGFVFVGVAVSPLSGAELSVSQVFGSSMVFQHSAPIAVWGDASPHSTIECTFKGNRATATANAVGEWEVALPPLPPSGEPCEMLVTSSSSNSSSSVGEGRGSRTR